MSDNINLETHIGNIKLKNPFINASGCWCYDSNELDQLMCSDSGSFITKTITLNPRTGNSKPRYYDNTYLSINSMGLPNMGFNYYNDYNLSRQKSILYKSKPFFMSISTMNFTDTNNMLLQLQNNSFNGISGIEFNISCPNIEGKGQLGYDHEQLDSFLTNLSEINLFDISRNNLAIGLKMSPYFDKYQFEQISDIIKKYPRIDFLTCINGIGRGLVVDFLNETSVIKPNNGLGGLGGSVVKPVGLSNTYQFKQIFGDKIDIVGCGGVSNAMDAFEYILSGASCVSVGTQLMKSGPQLFTRLNQDLKNIMISKKYVELNQFKNNLKINKN